MMVNQCPELAGTNWARHSWHALLSLPPPQPIMFTPHPQSPPSLGYLRTWHTPCLTACYTPISWLSQAERTNLMTGHIWPKRCFVPSLSSRSGPWLTCNYSWCCLLRSSFSLPFCSPGEGKHSPWTLIKVRLVCMFYDMEADSFLYCFFKQSGGCRSWSVFV